MRFHYGIDIKWQLIFETQFKFLAMAAQDSKIANLYTRKGEDK